MLTNLDSYRVFLQEELGRRIKANPSYSQRAFARSLQMSPGELSEILKGKRKLSLKSALKIVRAMGLNQSEARHLAYLVQLEKSRELGTEALLSERRPEDEDKISIEMFRIVSDWYCFAILNLAECDGFQWNVNWIAKRLEISETEVRIAIRRLEKVGLITRKKGKISVAKNYVISPDGIPSEAIRNYHRGILKRAMQALDLQNVNERENRGLCFAADPKSVASIKKDIKEFIDHLAAKYKKSRRKKEIYHLEMSFFKLSQGEDNAGRGN